MTAPADTEAPPGTGLRPIPSAFFLGAAVSFAVCCLLGVLGSREPLFKQFTRFYLQIAPEGLFYPTANQVRELGRQRLDPEKVAVVIGGNSIMYGVGQRPGNLWSERLQEQLGDDYCVLNLAMRGAGSHEFGGVAAEMILKDRPKLIFVSNLAPGYMPEEPDGTIYRYLFWDAYARGLIDADDERLETLRWFKAYRGNNQDFKELKLRMQVDRALHFNDLWTRVTHDHVGTVWNRFLSAPFTRPRRVYTDVDAPTPPELKYRPEQDTAHLRVIRGWIKNGREIIGEPEEKPNAYSLERAARRSYPASLRPHALLVIVRESPHYLDMLTPREQDQYDRLLTASVTALDGAGIDAMAVGRGFTPDDYCDRCHPSEEGGAKMAEAVAPRVRALAAKLGYVSEGGGR